MYFRCNSTILWLCTKDSMINHIELLMSHGADHSVQLSKASGHNMTILQWAARKVRIRNTYKIVYNTYGSHKQNTFSTAVRAKKTTTALEVRPSLFVACFGLDCLFSTIHILFSLLCYVMFCRAPQGGWRRGRVASPLRLKSPSPHLKLGFSRNDQGACQRRL